MNSKDRAQPTTELRESAPEVVASGTGTVDRTIELNTAVDGLYKEYRASAESL